MTETFKYDNLDRLDTVLFNNAVSEMVYDAYGRMRSKTSAGAVVFENAYYDDQSKPHAVRWAEVNGDEFPSVPQTIAYNMHDKVKSIQQGDDELTIDYGYDRQRIGMTQENDVLQTITSKIYVGNCEFNHGVSRAQRLTYLSGPMGVFAVYEELGPLYKGDDTDSGYTGALYYLHRDHLGSVTTITNASGAIVQELSYDAWGNLRNPTTWSGSFTGTPKFDRGYTGHEHLCTFGLINMNGRMYDPVMCCFLSVDTYVQDPGCAQNFNRYAYCLNNPLKYTDPDGEWVQYVIGGLLGAWNGYSIGKAAGLNGWDLFFSTIGGAAVGALSGGIGTYMSSVSTAAVGGLCGGVVSGAGNGLIQGLANKSDKLGLDVWNGLWKGGLSGLVGGYVGGGAGIYGGKGAFLGGIASGLTNEVCNYATVDNYKINWLNVGLGGAMSYGVYHAQAFVGYLAAGFYKKAASNLSYPKLTYSEYCDLLSLTQQSMREGLEGKLFAYYNKKPLQYLESAGIEHQVESNGADFVGAKMDYHTHTSFASFLEGGEGFSLIGTNNDYTTSQQLYELGYSNTRYLGTREGHIWFMNTVCNNGKYIQYQQRIPYDYNSSFYYYHHLFWF